jgi:serine/threonine-protein kinase RsbT
MKESQIRKICNPSDIIVARMEVREVAREQGFSMVDQARISLAASSLAKALGLGRAHQGQMVIDCVTGERGTGVRVVCSAANGGPDRFSPEALGDTRWMVDELTVERLPAEGVRVTAVKWDGAPQRTGVHDTSPRRQASLWGLRKGGR